MNVQVNIKIDPTNLRSVLSGIKDRYCHLINLLSRSAFDEDEQYFIETWDEVCRCRIFLRLIDNLIKNPDEPIDTKVLEAAIEFYFNRCTTL